MTAAEKLYQLIQTLPEEKVTEVLHFAEFLQQQSTQHQPVIPPGTLTGLRGIAKRLGATISNQELQADYSDYLIQKYQ
ncbi:DUF2281 domain-containing protein [Synechococcus elongatus]|uniref:DUF2281 domain-containing protein n=1 Tax=Synechococcus elongatus PCC 11802 TaxID=2283154 RepID=A0AAT9JQB9_SYNEL|nr:DUF2281 domain-containing protein [Synechococcus elongatus]